MRGVEHVALAFDGACREAGASYAFIGAVAVMAWGAPRATDDVDVLLVPAPDGMESLRRALSRRRLTLSLEDVADARRDGGHVTIFDEESPFYVDVKLAVTEAEREQVREAVEVPFRDGLLRVARPEETVAFKLSFASPKDLQDARSILLRQAGRLDMARLRDLARRLGVGAKLDQVLREAASQDPSSPA